MPYTEQTRQCRISGKLGIMPIACRTLLERTTANKDLFTLTQILSDVIVSIAADKSDAFAKQSLLRSPLVAQFNLVNDTPQIF